MTVDLWEGNIFNPFTLNKYLYVDANPVNYTDPLGLWTFADTSTAQGIKGNLQKIRVYFGKDKIKSAGEVIICRGMKTVGEKFEIHHIFSNKHKL